MQLAELQTFLAIVETGSLVKAAHKINVTQSTVTARLKSLESETGQQLIRRQKSGATMTAAGLKLHRHATTITSLWQQALKETSLPGGLSSICNFGCHPDLWVMMGEEIFNFIRAEAPDVAVSVAIGQAQDITRWLNDGLIDLALTYQPNVNQQQQVVTEFEDKLVLVSTSKDSPITFDPNYVFVDAGEEFEQAHAAAYADADTASISFNTAEKGLEHLRQHGGSAYLPVRMVHPLIEQGSLFLLRDAREFNRSYFLLSNKAASNAWFWFDECVRKTIELGASNE